MKVITMSKGGHMFDDDDRIDKTVDRTDKVLLTCANHPHLRWRTKNIGYIGARSIFFAGDISRPGYHMFPGMAYVPHDFNFPFQLDPARPGSIMHDRDEIIHELMTQGYVFECDCPFSALHLAPKEA